MEQAPPVLPPSHGWLSAAGPCSLTALVVVAWIAYGMQLHKGDWTEPWKISGDALHHLLIAEGLVQNGWWWHMPGRSAPYELDMVLFPVGGNVDYALMAVIA